ncbi:MAG: sigma-70 family RNA polymerase sigma factor [Actinomycetota bacterium]
MDPVEEVYRSQHDRLWKSLLAYTGDADTATEAAAETFSQAFSRGDQIREPQAWVWRTGFRIAAGMMAERRARSEAVSFDLEHVSLGDRGLDDPSLVEFVDLLQTLSDQQRTIVVLRYAGGFRPAEIAELLNTSSGTVRVQLHRAHEHLRKRLGQQ